MGLLDETLNRIQPLDQDAMEQAGQRWSDLYLGMGNLGKMEDMVVRYAASRERPFRTSPSAAW